MADLDIAVFLRARFDEQKALLNRVGPARLAWATFREADGSMTYTSAVSENADVWVCDGHQVEPASVQVVFDPAQELADVKAKRQIVDMWARWADGFGTFGRAGEAMEATLSLLALPYVGHPEFREEWKP